MRHRIRWLAARLALLITLALTACQSSPIPPPTPVPMPPAERLARGMAWRAAGDYDTAAAEFLAALQGAPGGPEARAARFHLAESFALAGRWAEAAETIAPLPAAEPPDRLDARAQFLLGRARGETGDLAGAVAAYEAYRALGTPAEPYVRLRQAAAEQALGRREAAAASYEAVAAADIVRGERAQAYERAIALRRELGHGSAALRLARDLLALARVPEYRARLLVELAPLAAEQGDADLARAWLREAATASPATPHALDAVARLLADPQGGLAPADAASVFEAHERWADAAAQLEIAASAAAGEAQLDLRRRQALAIRNGGDFAAALAALDAVVAAADPAGDVGRQARLDQAQTIGQSGATTTAIAAYEAFAAELPSDPRAPEALRRSAVLLDRLGEAEAAARRRVELGERYAPLPLAHEALSAGALGLHRLGRPADARAAWERLSTTATGVEQLRARYWAARAARAAGDEAGARTLLHQVVDEAPDSYYAARARELLGSAPVGQLTPGVAMGAADWEAIEGWLASWAQPQEAEAPPLHPAAQRALELAELGLSSEATAEWVVALDDADEPWALYRLTRAASERQMHFAVLRAAGRLAELAPGGDPSDAPLALRRLIYPTPFAPIVLAQAPRFGVDPALLYGLLRQESAFDPAAVSWAGAMGIAQVMPATGGEIAARLGVPEFRESDLLRPAVGVRFGASYLSDQLALMDGSVVGALAAYNGGPGNALRWAGDAPVDDPDMFVEQIDFPETAGYVRLVVGNRDAYRRLYRWP